MGTLGPYVQIQETCWTHRKGCLHIVMSCVTGGGGSLQLEWVVSASQGAVSLGKPRRLAKRLPPPSVDPLSGVRASWWDDALAVRHPGDTFTEALEFLNNAPKLQGVCVIPWPQQRRNSSGSHPNPRNVPHPGGSAEAADAAETSPDPLDPQGPTSNAAASGGGGGGPAPSAAPGDTPMPEDPVNTAWPADRANEWAPEWFVVLRTDAAGTLHLHAASFPWPPALQQLLLGVPQTVSKQQTKESILAKETAKKLVALHGSPEEEAEARSDGNLAKKLSEAADIRKLKARRAALPYTKRVLARHLAAAQQQPGHAGQHILSSPHLSATERFDVSSWVCSAHPWDNRRQAMQACQILTQISVPRYKQQ